MQVEVVQHGSRVKSRLTVDGEVTEDLGIGQVEYLVAQAGASMADLAEVTGQV